MIENLASYLSPKFDTRGYIAWYIGWIGMSLGLCHLHRIKLPLNKREQKSRGTRKEFIDFLRGWAITFVTFYHFMYNLSMERFVPGIPFFDRSTIIGHTVEFWLYFLVCFVILTEISYYSVYASYFWFLFITAVCIPWHYSASQVSGVGIMLATMGMASYVQNHASIPWKKVLTRVYQLTTVAVLISIVTYFVIHDEWIYFGAIHCIALLSLVHLPFVVFPQFALPGAVLITIHYIYYKPRFILDVPQWRVTADYMPWFVNLAYVLIGIFLAHKQIHKATHLPRCLWGRFRPGIRFDDTIFPFLGRHSLFIFIVHQVILFPVIKLLAMYC